VHQYTEHRKYNTIEWWAEKRNISRCSVLSRCPSFIFFGTRALTHKVCNRSTLLIVFNDFTSLPRRMTLVADWEQRPLLFALVIVRVMRSINQQKANPAWASIQGMRGDRSRNLEWSGRWCLSPPKLLLVTCICGYDIVKWDAITAFSPKSEACHQWRRQDFGRGGAQVR